MWSQGGGKHTCMAGWVPIQHVCEARHDTHAGSIRCIMYMGLLPMLFAIRSVHRGTLVF